MPEHLWNVQPGWKIKHKSIWYWGLSIRFFYMAQHFITLPWLSLSFLLRPNPLVMWTDYIMCCVFFPQLEQIIPVNFSKIQYSQCVQFQCKKIVWRSSGAAKTVGEGLVFLVCLKRQTSGPCTDNNWSITTSDSLQIYVMTYTYSITWYTPTINSQGHAYWQLLCHCCRISLM